MDHAAVIEPTRYKLCVHDYYLIAEAGVFGNNKRIELINGDLIEMAPIGQGHEAIVKVLNEGFVLACAGRAIVSTQNLIRLDLSSAPQPDLPSFGAAQVSTPQANAPALPTSYS